MSRTIEVVVEGGGANLYEIYESDGRFTAYKVQVKLLMPNSKRKIGSARSLEDALSAIKSHAGERIKSID